MQNLVNDKELIKLIIKKLKMQIIKIFLGIILQINKITLIVYIIENKIENK